MMGIRFDEVMSEGHFFSVNLIPFFCCEHCALQELLGNCCCDSCKDVLHDDGDKMEIIESYDKSGPSEVNLKNRDTEMTFPIISGVIPHTSDIDPITTTKEKGRCNKPLAVSL
jgi:hypothetical protein